MSSTTKGPVILTCFAGRKSCMSILMRYVHQLLKQGSIQEFHAWNFAKQKDDEEWLKTIHDPDNKIFVLHVHNKQSWREYYQFYTTARYGNDAIIIKSDDDIVYIDPTTFDKFVQVRRENTNAFLLFPSIVNNEMCAFYQQQAGMIPENRVGKMLYQPRGFGNLWADGKMTQRLHQHFLDSMDESAKDTKMCLYRCDDAIVNLPINDRISINFFAIRSCDLEIYQMVKHDDEGELTQILPGMLQRPVAMCFDMVVSHLAFFRQRETGLDVDLLLEKYTKLADKVLTP